MTEFKVGDEIQFDEDAVREAHRLDVDARGAERKGYAGRIIGSALGKGGVIMRTDYGDEAPFQIKVPGMHASVWAEESWLKPKAEPTKYVKINDGVETHSDDLVAGKIYPAEINGFGDVDILDVAGDAFNFGEHEVTQVVLADWEYELMHKEGEHGVTDLEDAEDVIPADKFQPGDVVNWVYSDGRQRANGYWDGSTIVKRCTSPGYEEYYEVRCEEGAVGAIHGDQLVLATPQEDDYDEWKANDSAEYYHSGDDSADSPDEAPMTTDYKPVMDEFQFNEAALDSLKTGGPYSMTFKVIPEVKDSNAPTVEELNKGIDISDYITDGDFSISDEALGDLDKEFQEDDKVNHPSHYTGFSNGAEVIDIVENLSFNRGNAVKYLARAGAKDPVTELQDLLKAQWYVNREISLVKGHAGE